MELKENGLAIFDVSVMGKFSNETYMGSFEAKCLLSPLEEIQADRTYRELLGVNSHLAQERVRRLAFAIAQLNQRLTKFPPFWDNGSTLKGSHIKDDNVILEVLDKAIEAQEKYVESKKEEMKAVQERMANAIKNKTIKPPQSDELVEEDESE